MHQLSIYNSSTKKTEFINSIKETKSLEWLTRENETAPQ